MTPIAGVCRLVIAPGVPLSQVRVDTRLLTEQSPIEPAGALHQ